MSRINLNDSMSDIRINLNDSMSNILMKMCDGNPGAINVLMQILKEADNIDPDSYSGSVSTLLNLDGYEIYGPEIWRLYKDVCGESIVKTVGILRSVQMGICPVHLLKQAIQTRYTKNENIIDVDALMALVREQLPNFSKA